MHELFLGRFTLEFDVVYMLVNCMKRSLFFS